MFTGGTIWILTLGHLVWQTSCSRPKIWSMVCNLEIQNSTVAGVKKKQGFDGFERGRVSYERPKSHVWVLQGIAGNDGLTLG